MPDHEWLRDIPAILDDAGEEVVLRLDHEPEPHTVRLMETLGVRIEVKEARMPVKQAEETMYCPHREFGCDWEYKGSTLRGAGFLEKHLQFSHPKCAFLLCEEPALPGLEHCRRHANVDVLREQRLALEAMDAGNSQEPPAAKNSVEVDASAGDAAKHGRKWTREEILSAIREHAEEHGHPPSATEWSSGGDHPSKGTVKREFGSWAAAVEAAGFERPKRGRSYSRQEPQQAPAAVPAVKPPPAPPEAATEPPESTQASFRDPLLTAALPFDPDALAEEAEFLRRRAKSLEQISAGIRGLQEPS